VESAVSILSGVPQERFRFLSSMVRRTSLPESLGKLSSCMERVIRRIACRTSDGPLEVRGGRNILERRQHNRYSVHARVNFKWQEDGILNIGSGLTRDISPNGMFVYSDSVPPEKADIELDISFANANTNLHMSATALVIRVEGAASPEGHSGFAVLNRSYALHSRDERMKLK
jgi:hypothetical protein